LTEQVDEAYLQKKIQEIRRKDKQSKVAIIVGAPILIIIGWAMYNFKIYHRSPFGTSWVEYPFRPFGLVPIIGGILAIVIGSLGLYYRRLQKKKYMEQLRQLQQR